ncbi:MAG: tripartite tricarboxylate transporter TctB family protein [Deltaproteobacteria bacterium]|nr:tripartite tricarboxylate transporter TctB family protein [Deltaproteobacteria bacterium]MBW2308756.1 tripartite tricarboxylate transporter TctB family protein [Deltaproteobacteria bacterium]
MRFYDFVSTLAFCILGLLVIVGGIRLGFGHWNDPGQGFMAILSGITLSILSVLWLAITLVKKSTSGTTKTFFPAPDSYKKMILTLLPVVLYALLLNKLGFLITTFLFLIFLFKVIEPQRWSKAIGTAFIATVCSFCLFQLWLNVQFPDGLISIYWIKKWIY